MLEEGDGSGSLLSQKIKGELEQNKIENKVIEDINEQKVSKIRSVFELLQKYDKKLDIITNTIKSYRIKKQKKKLSLIDYNDFIELNRIEEWNENDCK